MLAKFQAESLADAKPSSCQECKQHFVTALALSEDFFDFLGG
jgi:hypothetical protein